VLGIPNLSLRTIAGLHEVVDLPGGPFVMGSVYGAEGGNALPPHWVRLSPFAIGRTPVTEGTYRKIMDRPKSAPNSHPVTNVTWEDALDYCGKVDRRNKGDRRMVHLPTEPQWEFAARGPAVNLRKAMEEEVGSFKPRDFPDFVSGRFENFCFELELGADLFTDPRDERFLQLLRTVSPVYGWRLFPTRSGRLTRKEVVCDRDKRFRAGAGKPNAYGIKMAGGVAEWTLDGLHQTAHLLTDHPVSTHEFRYKIQRGVSWFFHPGSWWFFLAAARTATHPSVHSESISFRIAVSSHDPSDVLNF
jgi:formylglycine-generating enzyme required for sulfatase activity